MTEIKEEKKPKPFVVIGSTSVMAKYKSAGKDVTVHLIDGKIFTGKVRWYDDYAVKIIMPDGSGSITIPIHNILYYECEKFFLEDEKEGKISARVFRGVPKSTNKEREQIFKYKKKNELLQFCLENGHEIKGRLNWFLDHVYCVRPDSGERDYQITKRHILYYRKIEMPKPARTESGTIKMINTEKGFGFIIFEGGDMFFHRSEVEGKWEDAEPGQEVDFGIMEGKKGKVAVNIKLKG